MTAREYIEQYLWQGIPSKSSEDARATAAFWLDAYRADILRYEAQRLIAEDPSHPADFSDGVDWAAGELLTRAVNG